MRGGYFPLIALFLLFPYHYGFEGIPSFKNFCDKRLASFNRFSEPNFRERIIRKGGSDAIKLSILSTAFSITSMLTPAQSFARESVLSEVWKIVNENFFDETFNNNDWKNIKTEYEQKLSSGANEQALTKKMLSLLGDKYTRLLDKEQFESLWKYDAIGIGLLFQSDPGKELFVAGPPISGSSGQTAGIQKGDIIVSINGRSSLGMTAIQVLDMMSNDESKTVEIEFARPSGSSTGSSQLEKKKVVLNRSTQKAANPVSYSVESLSNGSPIGYVRLSEFNAEAVNGLRAALTELKLKDVQEVVLDLRGNTGGGFQFALNIGGMFMDDKVMVTAMGKNSEKNVFKSSYIDGVIYDKPLVLLTDGLSASASEVLAGGLHDNCRAVLAGTTTFGKGKIQAVFGLADGEGMTMTVAQYVTPRGTIIQSRGLEPDIPLAGQNTYLNLVVGPSITKPDFKTFDFKIADEKLTLCKANNLPIEAPTTQATKF